MSKSWNRLEIAAVLVAMLVGVALTAIVALPAYLKATTERFHPDPAQAPSVTDPDRSRGWADAVERGRAVVRARLGEQNLPGLSVAVGAGGEIVWAEGFGFAELEKRTPVSPKHRFRIGTASAVLTSAAVGLLLESGRLSLDDDIQKHVPQFPKKEWPVTVRQVMGHVAGVRSDGGDEGPLFGQHCERPVEALDAFAERDLLFQPGTRYRFSNYGFLLMSAAVEAASGEPFLAFMRRRVFEPLGMNDTLAESAREPIPGRPKFYFPRFGADPRYGLHDMRELDLSCYSGAMGFLSTPSDLVRFGLAINGGKLLKPATLEALQTPQRLAKGESSGYGLGWDLQPVALAGGQARTAGHDGRLLGGAVASLRTFPERGLAVAVTSNISYADTPGLASKIAQAFAQQAPAGSQ